MTVYPVSSWAVALADDTSVSDVSKYYPVTPSSPDWKLLTTSEEMIQACQIKPELLAKLTTEEVIEAVLSYPLLGDVFYFNTVGSALQNLLLKSDAYRELITRPDAESCLLDRYNEIKSGVIKVKNKTLAVATISLLLSYGDENAAATPIFLPTKNIEVAGRDTISTTQVNVPYYYVDDVVSTPIGNPVRVLYTPVQYTQADIEYLNQDVLARYPNAILYGNSSLAYNCHNFAWNTEYTMSFWMNMDSAKIYMSDGSYIPTTRSNASRIYYGDVGDHSGLIVPGPNVLYKYVLSKWGSGPLLMHIENYCPYYYSTTYPHHSYWVEA